MKLQLSTIQYESEYKTTKPGMNPGTPGMKPGMSYYVGYATREDTMVIRKLQFEHT